MKLPYHENPRDEKKNGKMREVMQKDLGRNGEKTGKAAGVGE